MRGLTYELIDHYLGRPYVDWAARYKQLLTTMLTNAKTAVEARAAVPQRSAHRCRSIATRSIQGPMVRTDYRIAGKIGPRHKLQRDSMSGPLVHFQ